MEDTFNKIVPEGQPPEEGNHQHKCSECDTVWEHLTTIDPTEKEHRCPQCGTLQSWHYNPDLDKPKARKHGYPERLKEMFW